MLLHGMDPPFWIFKKKLNEIKNSRIRLRKWENFKFLNYENYVASAILELKASKTFNYLLINTLYELQTTKKSYLFNEIHTKIFRFIKYSLIFNSCIVQIRALTTLMYDKLLPLDLSYKNIHFTDSTPSKWKNISSSLNFFCALLIVLTIFIVILLCILMLLYSSLFLHFLNFFSHDSQDIFSPCYFYYQFFAFIFIKNLNSMEAAAQERIEDSQDEHFYIHLICLSCMRCW